MNLRLRFCDKRLVALAQIAFASAIVCGFTIQPTYSQRGGGAITGMLPVDFILDSPDCLSEQIHLTGEFRYVIHQTQGPSGGVHSIGHLNFVGVTGVGLSTGTIYHVPTSSTNVENVVPNGEFIFTSTNVMVVSSVGPSQNLVLNWLLHYIIDPNGELRLEVSNVAVQCV